ncbi:MAG: glutathione S-transferase family protein [Woeseiaceae bacterium]|nr:glutathione S-transferase family protein [Woeseiaceae bacterium]
MRYQLVSFPICPYVQRARILLDAKGIDYDTSYIDLDDKPDWFTERVPTAKVPALFVGDTTLFESNVITEYLDDVSSMPLLPDEPLQRATEKAWIAYSDSWLMSLFRALKSENKPEYAKQVNSLLEGCDNARSFIESRLAHGYRLGAFEIAVAPLLLRIRKVPDIRAAFRERFKDSSRIGLWAQTVLSEDAVQGSLPDDFDERFSRFFDLDNPAHPANISALGRLTESAA